VVHIVVCDLENLKNEEAVTRTGSQRHRKKKDMFYTLLSTFYGSNHLSVFLPICDTQWTKQR